MDVPVIQPIVAARTILPHLVSVTVFQRLRYRPDLESLGSCSNVLSLLSTGVCTCASPRPASFCFSSRCRLLQQENKLAENVEGVLDREREHMNNLLSGERAASARRIAALHEELETAKRRLELERKRNSNVSGSLCGWAYIFYSIVVNPFVTVTMLSPISNSDLVDLL